MLENNSKELLTKYKRLIPEKLLNRGINLIPIGTNELGWKYSDIIEILSLADFIVLGGDVLSKNNSVIKFTYDSWYYNYDKNLSDQENIAKSIMKATSYINKYHELNGDSFIYSLVIREK